MTCDATSQHDEEGRTLVLTCDLMFTNELPWRRQLRVTASLRLSLTLILLLIPLLSLVVEMVTCSWQRHQELKAIAIQ